MHLIKGWHSSPPRPRTMQGPHGRGSLCRAVVKLGLHQKEGPCQAQEKDPIPRDTTFELTVQKRKESPAQSSGPGPSLYYCIDMLYVHLSTERIHSQQMLKKAFIPNQEGEDDTWKDCGTQKEPSQVLTELLSRVSCPCFHSFTFQVAPEAHVIIILCSQKQFSCMLLRQSFTILNMVLVTQG